MPGKKKTFIQKDGFSLIELVIVISIMAILTGLAALGFGYLRSADAKGVANGINSGLSNLKSENMAKSKKTYMHLYELGGSYYIKYVSEDAESSFSPDDSGKEIGKSTVEVSCDGAEIPEEGIRFSVQKKDGAFGDGPKQIDVEASNGSHYRIILIKDTGKHYME
ncbi:MAG: prepilin-type N-terminal cleavage/methylation domain-containing protein [Lachnospiraceae bacterium]|nr:prepilin-type N-terminal cleavage/methylation domain-containing protein [Lachnospiraceae bacterium]